MAKGDNPDMTNAQPFGSPEPLNPGPMNDAGFQPEQLYTTRAKGNSGSGQDVSLLNPSGAPKGGHAGYGVDTAGTAKN